MNCCKICQEFYDYAHSESFSFQSPIAKFTLFIGHYATYHLLDISVRSLQDGMRIVSTDELLIMNYTDCPIQRVIHQLERQLSQHLLCLRSSGLM